MNMPYRPEPAPSRPPDKPKPGDIARFQGSAAAIEQSSVPWAARSVQILLVAIIAFAVGWAALSTMETVVTGPGRLTTVEPLVVVQPLNPGVIRSFPVSTGDRVEAGQTVAVLDPTFTEADVSFLDTTISRLAAEIARLRAEAAGEDEVGPSPASSDADLAEQRALFYLRKAEYTSRLGELSAAVESEEANVRQVAESAEVVRKRMKVIGEIETMRQDLFSREVGSKLELLTIQEQGLAQQQELTRLENDLGARRSALAAAVAARETYRSNWMRMISERLVEAETKLAEARAEHRKATRYQSLVELRSPVSGVVLEVATLSIGSVAQAAEQIVTIVPDTAELIADFQISPSEVGSIKLGDPVKIKVAAFPFQKHGAITGTLITLAPDVKQIPAEEGGGAFYRARARFDPVSLEKFDARDQLRPGMDIAAEIVVGERVVLTYFIYPLIRYLDESLREP